jgi:hypothetical protein
MVEEVLGAGGAWAWREEKRSGGGAVEDGEAGVVLTWARAVVRWSGDDARRRRWRSSMEVVLKLREGRRRVGVGAVKIRRRPRPFIGVGGR